MSSPKRSEAAVGLLYTLAAFILWGLAPIFWKALGHIPAEELLGHRTIWCGLLMALILAGQGRLSGLPALLRRRRTLAVLLATTLLIGSNWFVFIWAVNSGHILQASLGYFINPLISVLLGILFLGERLRRWQGFSVALATFGVLVMAWSVGQVPWVSLYLAFSFAFYALLRKKVAASPEEGLGIETWILTPVALIYLVWLERSQGGAFGHADLATHALLVATSVVTAAPLVWFTHGARRLPLATVGLLQYLAPTMQFLLAVLVFREPFAMPQLVAFLFIWTALAIFTWDARARWRAEQGAPA